MREIEALPWNGFKVASTFSGAGGSCTGYRMAGFKVIWANEFVPVAQESYRANKAADGILDPRDIKHITAEDILRATGLKSGELDIFDGSPPCQAFSTAGQREKGWGKKKSYEHGASQCNEQLFDEYIRLLNGLQPKVFIAENVSGLVKGTAKGYFLDILQSLKKCGYKVKASLLDAAWLGVPQTRERLIFVGVREDIPFAPRHPNPLPYQYTVREALPHISEISSNSSYIQTWHDASTRPAATITATVTDKINAVKESGSESARKLKISEVRVLSSFPPDFQLAGTVAQQWERLGNSVPPLMMNAVAEVVRDKILIPYRDEVKANGRAAATKSSV